MTNVCLDLFCGLGGFSQAFADADDWTVVTVDIDESFGPDYRADVLDLRPGDVLDMLPVDDWDAMDQFVILAGHPCTYFTAIRNVTAGGDPAWSDDGTPVGADCRDHVAMLHHTVGLIRAAGPDWWVLENPYGSRVADYLGDPDYTVWQCQYGREYAKPTWLWGDLPPSFEPRSCRYGSDDCDHVKTQSDKDHGGGSDDRQGLLTEAQSDTRAVVPYELSDSIREAVENPDPVASLSQFV